MRTRIILRVAGSLLNEYYIRFSRIIKNLKGRIRHLDTLTGVYDAEIIITREDINYDFISKISKLSRYCSATIRVYITISDENELLDALRRKNVKYIKLDGRMRFAMVKNGIILLYEYNSKSRVLSVYVVPNVYNIVYNIIDASLLAISEFSSYIASSIMKCDSTLLEDITRKVITYIKELLID